ncbi:glycosyltransferase family 4 protein [Thiohalocapsa halophila]|nr:glycosyltransferase family 4 protein [Thiohalocapsa halophila]
MAKVVVTMLGARMHYAVPRLLYEAGLLERFFTDSYSGNKPWLRLAAQAIPRKVRPAVLERWLGRDDAALSPERVVSFEGLGWWYAHARRRARSPGGIQEVFNESAARFNQLILAHPAFVAGDVVWGFNGASLALFAAAQRQGRRCILEQTILPKRLATQLLAEEAERWPGWEASAAGGGSPPVLDPVLREEHEWALADRIVAGSAFVRDGLVQLGVAEDKIRVVPYGVDAARFVVEPAGAGGPDQTARRGPLRILFAGQVGVRKGVPDLLQALRRLPVNAVDCRLAGPIGLAADKLRDLPGAAQLLGPVPRSRMGELFRWAEVLVLPSLVEGSATVTYEALMSGLPVIATPNAGAPVRDGVDGSLVPIRNPQVLADAFQRYLDAPDLLRSHQNAALKDRARLGLETYRDNLVGVVQELAGG